MYKNPPAIQFELHKNLSLTQNMIQTTKKFSQSEYEILEFETNTKSLIKENLLTILCNYMKQLCYNSTSNINSNFYV